MDYEKKYKEALERAKTIIDGKDGWNFADHIEIDPVIKEIFPELRESEDKDERMLKKIISYLEMIKMGCVICTIDTSEEIAWLEKQKESLHILETCKENADSFTQETPMPNSTTLLKMWDDEEKMLREKDFRGDTWRIAYNAFMDGFARGTCVKFEKQKEPENTSASTMAPSCWEVEQKEQKPKNILTNDDSLQTAYLKGQTDVIEDPEAYGLQKEQKPTPDWMPKFLDELRSKKNYFDWDEHRDIEGHILAIINWIAPNYFDRKEKERKSISQEDFDTAKHEALWEEQKPNSTEDMPYIADEHFYERAPADSFKYKLAEYMTKGCTKKEGPYGYTYAISAETILKMAEEELLKRGVVQKPAEWSEEDENYLGVIVRLVEQVSGWPERAITEYTNWLKSLRPQPKQEVTDEEIEEMVTKRARSSGTTKSEMAFYRNGIKDAIKRFGLRPSWKPSEEHLSALLAVFNDPDNIGSQTCQLALTDLYEQLKKL